MSKIVLLSHEPVKYLREDGGYTLRYILADPQADHAFNIVLQSTEEGNSRRAPAHVTAREFAGKRVKVTIEVV